MYTSIHTPTRSKQKSETMFGTFLWSLEHVRVILIAVDTLSNTDESEKTNYLIDDPDPDVTYHRLREQFSLGNGIYKPRCWSRAKVRVNGRPIW